MRLRTTCYAWYRSTSSLESGPTKELLVFQIRLKLVIQDLLIDAQHWKEDGVLLCPGWAYRFASHLEVVSGLLVGDDVLFQAIRRRRINLQLNLAALLH